LSEIFRDIGRLYRKVDVSFGVAHDIPCTTSLLS
jgi:hypothetical protein